jgi:iron complex outermembrane receptor protein
MKYTSILIASLLFRAIPAFADALTGRLLDPQGGVVGGAEILLYDRNRGNTRKTISDGNGGFTFQDIQAGSYIFQVKHAGSALAVNEEVKVSGETAKDVTLSLRSTTQRIVVSATGTPVFEQEVARVVDVVDSQQIQERDEYSVAEVLRATPGIQVQTQVGGVTQIRTRGLPNQYTAVLIDGMRFRDAVATQGDASGFMSDMNVTDLGRVEFMRGSGSSLYGTNAIGGAINLSSNDGGGKFHGAVRAEGGQLGFFRSTANLAGGVKQNRFVYSGGASSLNVTGGVRGSTPNKNNSGQLFGKYNFSPKVTLSGRVWGADVFQRSVDSPAFNAAILANFPAGTSPVKAILLPDDQLSLYEKRLPFSAGNATVIPSVPDPDGSRNSSFAAAAFIFRQELTPTTSWRASYSLVDTKRAFLDGPAGASAFDPQIPNISNFNGRTNQLQLRFDSAALAQNLITGGYEFERESIDSLGTRAQVGGALIQTTGAQNSHSLYIQDQLAFLDRRLQIVIGGRIQKFDLKQPGFATPAGERPSPYQGTTVSSPGTSYTGDISVAYFVASTGTKFRGHFGNGYRAPSLYERFGSGYSSTTGNFTYYGDPRLPSEKSKSFDGGIDQYLFANKLRASATYFYTDLSQTIIFGTFPAGLVDPFGRNSGYRNSEGGGVSRGAELSLFMTPTRSTTVTTSYTHVNADTRFPTVVAGLNYYGALRTANNIFSVTGTQWITRRLNVTADFYAISDPVENPFGANRLMAYAGPKKLDLVVNYNIPVRDRASMDVYVNVQNATNRRYSDNGFLAPGAWAICGLKFNF